MLAALGLAGVMIALCLGKPMASSHYPVFQKASTPATASAISLATPTTRVSSSGVEVVIFKGQHWQVSRHHPSGYLAVDNRDLTVSHFNRLELQLDWRKNVYPMLILEGPSRDLFVAVYDVILNSPSGRRLESVTSGIDLYRLTGNFDSKPQRLAQALPIGGIDTLIYGRVAGDQVHLCGENRCFSVDGQGNSIEWELQKLREYEFVELAFHNDLAAALLRMRCDDRSSEKGPCDAGTYYLAVFNQKGVDLKSLETQEIPWDLHWKDDTPFYRLAGSESDYRHVLNHDLHRMPLQGFMDFGTNNLEGRVAWSQVNYLNGLLSVLARQTHRLAPYNERSLRKRVEDELHLLATLTQNDYPGLRVKRYSLDREPLLFALHLGRVASLILRAEDIVGLQVDQDCLKWLNRQLRSLELTVEECAAFKTGSGEFPYLRYRKGFPFWADGVNVPYNYVSGYAEALLGLGGHDPVVLEHVRGLLTPLLVNEFGKTYPKSWRYWWGAGREGWKSASGLSLNTPQYSGNQEALAHISYRTMDAKALIALKQHDPSAIPDRLIEHLRSLTQTGWLLPDMNERWVQMGGTVELTMGVARRHARSAAKPEISSQVWALNQLAEVSKDD